MPDEPTSPAAARDDRDLYCLQCGYNLRGLSGDPRRCPECGQMNAVAEIEIPAELITRQLLRMERAPSTCVLALLAVLACITIVVHDLREGAPDLRQLLCAVAAAAAAHAWWVCMRRFRSYSGAAEGWRRALFNYHWRCSAIVAVIAALLYPGTSFLIFDALPPVMQNCTVLTICVAVVILGGNDWVRRRSRRELAPLQRVVAVRLAREQLGREIERQFNRGPE